MGETKKVPSVGRIVHYVDNDGGWAHRAAIITEVLPDDEHETQPVALCVFGVKGLLFLYPVELEPTCVPNTWHWPEYVG